MAARTLSYWINFKPHNAKIFIVDDGSYPALFGADYRFEISQGVSIAKNKCLELSEGFDYVFCVDDDTRPLSASWHLPYIESGLNHACYTFDRKIIQITETFTEYEKPCGCMLFFTKYCIDTAGGWDTSFKGYGLEHVSLSDRIFNMGLTPARYIDATGSAFSLANCETSFTFQDKQHLPENIRLYKENYFSKEFKPYK